MPSLVLPIPPHPAPPDPDTHMAFSEDCLKAVLDAYPPIVDKHKDDEFTEQQKQWQLMRRGRC